MTTSGYDRFAGLYSRHWATFSARIMPALERLMLAGLPKHAEILDLCCGAGHLAAQLAGRGYRVTGIDQSRAMIEQARRNAPRATFETGDARTLDLAPGAYDAATCMFDSLNHMMSMAELRSVMANVHRALRPAGRFVFDLNAHEGYLERWKGEIHFAEPDCVCMVKARYDADLRVGRNEVTLFEKDGAWKRTDLTLEQKCHETSEVLDALASAGFADVTTYEARRDFGLENAGGRLLFACSKVI
jgi:SAM-dependent methyltransferase